MHIEIVEYFKRQNSHPRLVEVQLWVDGIMVTDALGRDTLLHRNAIVGTLDATKQEYTRIEKWIE